MTHYGTLRAWAFIATLVGVFGMIAAGIGAIVWAFEVEGFWQTVGVLLRLPVASSSRYSIALGQAMRAIADVGTRWPRVAMAESSRRASRRPTTSSFPNIGRIVGLSDHGSG
jgi:hypothetical protein